MSNGDTQRDFFLDKGNSKCKKPVRETSAVFKDQRGGHCGWCRAN